MSTFTDLPRDLQILISNYEPKFIVLCEPLDCWNLLLRQNFGLKFTVDVPCEELRKLYINRCLNRKSIFCGSYNTFVRLGSKIVSVGSNLYGQLGRGIVSDCAVLGEIKGMDTDVKGIISGVNHTIIQLSDGKIMSCGNNSSGQSLHRGRRDRTEFEEVNGLHDVKLIACGDYFTYIELCDGRIMVCGSNRFGQLGIGDISTRTELVEIHRFSEQVCEIVCCSNNTFVRLSNGTLFGCGCNGDGQLGLGDRTDRTVFTEIRGVPRNVCEIVCSGYHTIIRLSDGRIMGSGHNGYGQLGCGDRADRTLFEEIRGIRVTEIACGNFFTYIRTIDGRIMSCGDNLFGQCGHGDNISRRVFEEISGIPRNVAEISCKCDHVFVRLTDGRIMACGHNGHGELGTGDINNRFIFEEINLK